MARKASHRVHKQEPSDIVESESEQFPSGLVGEILHDLPKDTPPSVIQKITQAISYSGPIPLSSEFARYEDVLPGAADRILSMAEKEQDIRHKENGKLLHNDIVKIYGSILVSLCLIGAGVYCGVIGQPWLGGVLGTSGAVAGVMSGIIKRIG